MVRRASGRLVLSGLFAPVLVAGLLLPAVTSQAAGPSPDDFSATQIDPGERVVGAKAPSSRLAQTDPELLARTDSDPVSVLIKLDHDATASYAGGVGDLAPTSPSVTGRELTGASAAEQAYTAYQESREDGVVGALEQAVPSADVGQALRTVYGGIAATIPANQVETVLAIDGVTAVQKDELNQLLTDSSPEFVNAPPVYDQMGGAANAGEGVIYGNLDSGVWPEHPSFADQGNLKPPPGPARECDFGDNPLTPTEDKFVCNNKLIGGAAFLDAYLAVPELADAEPYDTTRDSNGHGTHTASTSAGNIVEDVTVLGSPKPPIQGLAPGAWVMEYKVCGIAGCFGSDSAAAVGQAVLDGVDVINFSISGGTDPFTDPVELAFLDAYAAGVFVAASAGNSGPTAATANHLSPWVTTVGASTQDREFATTLTLTSGGDTATFEGASITPGVESFPVVMASDAPYSDTLCQEPAPAGIFEGLIVACERGVNARVDKGYNVLQGGAEAMVLYNPTLADTGTDTHWLPTVQLADGTDFVAFMEGNGEVIGSFPAGTAQQGQGDVMAAFSSRGPAGLFLKPDVTAPGVQIMAGDTPIQEATSSGPPGEYFQAIAGTSMSSPHVAGAAILGRAVHPDWTPGQLKSALMTTAITDVLKEDLATPADPFDMGSGRIDVGRSAGVALTLDETAANYFAMGGSPLTAVHLNVPSIYAPVMPGRLITTRTVTNPTDRTVVVRASAEAPEGSTIEVTPRTARVRAGHSVELTITITSDAPIGEQQFGTVLLEPRGGGEALHLPVAFTHTQGTVGLTQSCEPDSISLRDREESTCTVEAVNNSFDEQVVDLDSTVNRNLRITGAEGATLDRGHVRLNHVTLAGAELGVPSVTPGASPAGGYLPLEDFGITPQAIGDEDFLNFDVPAFDYNGQAWTSIGVNSNGYIVAGGGTSEDNECCNIPDGESPAPPNNMLAPFWTDLDGTDAPGIFAATLGDGANTWLIVEYQVNVFGTSDLRTFQAWIGLNSDADPGQDISYTYAEAQADPGGQPFLVGAENAVGEGDMEAVLPSEDLRVTSTDPTPGDVASYTFTVAGRSRGEGVVTTEMRADGVPGVTIVRSTVQVRAR